VLYCVLKLCTVIGTRRWAVLTILWIGFCHTGPISLCVDLFVFICVYFVCFCFILHSCCIIVSTLGRTWWDWSLILRTYLPSVLWHCWLGHLTRKNPLPIWPTVCLVGRQTLLNQFGVMNMCVYYCRQYVLTVSCLLLQLSHAVPVIRNSLSVVMLSNELAHCTWTPQHGFRYTLFWCHVADSQTPCRVSPHILLLSDSGTQYCVL